MNNNNNNNDSCKINIVDHMNSIVRFIKDEHDEKIQEANEEIQKTIDCMEDLNARVDQQAERMTVLREGTKKFVTRMTLDPKDGCMKVFQSFNEEEQYQQDQDDHMRYDHEHGQERAMEEGE